MLKLVQCIVNKTDMSNKSISQNVMQKLKRVVSYLTEYNNLLTMLQLAILRKKDDQNQLSDGTLFSVAVGVPSYQILNNISEIIQFRSGKQSDLTQFRQLQSLQFLLLDYPASYSTMSQFLTMLQQVSEKDMIDLLPVHATLGPQFLMETTVAACFFAMSKMQPSVKILQTFPED